jgi:ParB family chromosome partitioning protein
VPETKKKKPVLSMTASRIKVGDRARRKPGSLVKLKDSLTKLGMLSPIGILPNRELLFGFRRLRAAQELGWAKVPVVVIKNLSEAWELSTAERDENTEREPMAPSELAALGLRIEEQLKPKAAEAKAAGASAGGKARWGEAPATPKADADRVNVRKQVAETIGTGEQTYARAKKVTQKAKADPDNYGDLPAKMDDESVAAAHAELERREAEEAAKAAGPTEPVDAVGEVIPKGLVDTFGDPFLDEMIAKLQVYLDTMELDKLSSYASRKGQWFPHLDFGGVLNHLRQSQEAISVAMSLITHARPYAVCPSCHGKLKRGVECGGCRSSGYLTKALYDETQRA